jgi:hypothetical protein
MGATTKDVLYRLLASALLDLRIYGHASGDQRVFLLADLFHNVPLQLEQVDRGETTPDEIMDWLWTRAQRNGPEVEGWLELRIEEAARRYGHVGASGEDTPA